MDVTGLNHIVVTIGAVERSKAFYGELLGFEIGDIDDEHPEYGFYFATGGVYFFLGPSRRPTPDDRFDEMRIGLDHFSFTVPTEEVLRRLADRLIAAGVDTKGVETFASTGNLYVAFRDPDNIQLEYWLP